MTLYRITDTGLAPIEKTSFQAEGIQERRDLQRLIRGSIKEIVPDTMALAEEFGDWEESCRRIDLLGLDSSARLVVVELKRTEDGGHMELQALRYAAMVSKMTFENAVQAHKAYLENLGRKENAEETILKFLGWDEPQEEEFTNDVCIILASAEFSKELTTSVIWLNERDIDIRCVRLKPYRNGDEVLIDVQQNYPLPEAADYQVKLREKERQERRSRTQNRDLTRFDLTVGDESFTNLPKRRLVNFIVHEAVRRGAPPKEVLSTDRAWIIVNGERDQENFLKRAEEDREPGSSSASINRFFTEDDELMHWEGRTYALTKMWGRSTRGDIDRIITKFDLEDVYYREAS
jgi:hypothetical protein